MACNICKKGPRGFRRGKECVIKSGRRAIVVSGILLALLLVSGCAIPFIFTEQGGYFVGLPTGQSITWPNDLPGIVIVGNSFPSELREKMENGIRNGVKQFNKNPSNLEFRVDSNTEWHNNYGPRNGRSEIYIGYSDLLVQADGSKSDAVAVPITINGTIVECDIVINPDTAWTDSLNPEEYTSAAQKAGAPTPRALADVIVHELGHCAGLEHQTEAMGVMGDNNSYGYQNGGNRLPYVGVADASLLGNSYGYNPAKSDIVVSTYKFSGHSEFYYGGTWEYGVNESTDLTTQQGEVINSHEPVEPGQDYDAEFTYESLRDPTQTPVPFNIRADYILSREPFSSSAANRLLKTETIDLSNTSVPLTRKTRVTIPADLECGTWRIGVAADPLHEITQIVDATDPMANSHMAFLSQRMYIANNLKVFDIRPWGDTADPAASDYTGDGGQLRYYLLLGCDYSAQFTVKNLPERLFHSNFYQVDFVLSRDAAIQGEKRLLKSQQICVEDITTSPTKTIQLTIPDDIEQGNWYLGTVITRLYGSEPTTQVEAVPITIATIDPSELTTIAGIDEAKKDALIARFGSANKLVFANFRDIWEFLGNRDVAEKLFSYLLMRYPLR